MKLVLGALLLGATTLAAAVPAGAAAPTPGPQQRVVVQSTGDRADAVRAVRAAGGRVTHDLPIVDGVSATVPAAARHRVATAPGVLAVTDDLAVGTAGAADQGGRTVPAAVLSETGADVLQRYGVDGRGSTVALVDTGISPVADLRGRVLPVADPDDASAPDVACVNFSGEPTCDDGYGHGTFVAGLIAGDGAASGGTYRGTAPGADLVSVKIADRTGASDVTKVLAAIQWVVSFRERYGIDVLNLSLGTDSDTDPSVDPLNRAVQRATAAGIVVVVAAGNAGTGPGGTGTVFKPGDDPSVLTVGAVDDLQTATTGDDRVPAFTSRGPTAQGLAKPDLAAPGAHLVSLRVPGSYVEEQAKGAGVVDASYRRGSGSSFATGVVSGLVAAVHQVHPDWTPARVKAALAATADPARLGEPAAVGAGIAYAPAAVFSSAQGVPTAVAGGQLGVVEAARGSVHVVRDDCGSLQRTLDRRCTDGITGETTSQGRTLPQRFDPSVLSQPWTPETWYSSPWSGNSWLGNSWLGNSWLGNSWLGNSWLGDDTGSDSSYGTPRSGSAFYGTAE
ncbi:MAG: Serine protease AprX [Frankiales bacterium]|nr:Serine protease AprX [Frankiales bacterium]